MFIIENEKFMTVCIRAYTKSHALESYIGKSGCRLQICCATGSL